MQMKSLIANKRDGQEHTPQEIEALVSGYTQGTVPDYQMSAWLMAVCCRGLSERETLTLASAMAASGTQMDWSALPGMTVDKHSTGGVGDKTTLAVVPIVASAGVPMIKMSGHGLGHTGGTLDKLQSISGLRVDLSLSDIQTQVQAIGACLCAQTQSLVPADRQMYALRDATSTVESLPLIAASVMSKKLAVGASAITLDVKVGSGAFMKTLADARFLAQLMIHIGTSHGRTTAAVLTDMSSPLGRAVGNALEVAEANALLREPHSADPRLTQIVFYLSAMAFVQARLAHTLGEGIALAYRQIESGAAWSKWKQIIQAQGGDAEAPLPLAPVQKAITATRGGFITGIDALAIGRAAMQLGAGQAAKREHLDPGAGIIMQKSVGDLVNAGDTLAILHTCSQELAAEAYGAVSDAFIIADQPSEQPPLIYETIGIHHI